VHVIGDLSVLRELVPGPEDAVDDTKDLPVDGAIAAMLGALQGSQSAGLNVGGHRGPSWARRARTWVRGPRA